MDKQQAHQLIQDVFKKAYDHERYRHFLRNLLNRFEPRDVHYTGNYIPDAFRQHVNQYWRIGKYVDPEGRELDLLAVEVKSLAKLERARSSLRNFAVNRLKQFEKEASLIAFYAQDDSGADWRFSFVKIEHEAYKDGKGKVKLKQELTPAKRYSYLVGAHENSRTASQQLLPLLEMDYADPRLEEIEAAFSIEKVTDEFFDQYKTLFQKLAEHLMKQRYFKRKSDEEADQEVSRFAKKLLGQIVFLYFLQKKGWLGVPKGGRWGQGSKRFMRERYEQAEREKENYYHDFLQYLFYEALADERKRQKDPGYYARFDCRVPFLNGGLFEADYDWQNITLDLPNSLFHNNERTKAGDSGTGILDVFDRYNFTIKEDEPLEKEVAVDPEMLGKVFENMLEVTERKSKGAFYTPREIVHYMCQESLIHYLDNRLNTYSTATDSTAGDLFAESTTDDIKVPKVDLETLIRKGHLVQENDARVISKGKETDTYKFQLPDTVRRFAKEIDTALHDIRVCDPAIGSGAFPVGLLHEIVNARLALAPHSSNTQSAYELKRHVIAECHYGVDIDPSAIDIARLRLWLSLIVDEEDFDKIEALPNLDYKIVQGDSLIGFPDNWPSPAFGKIESLKKQFFAETDHKKKDILKRQIGSEIQHRLDGSKKIFGYQVEFDFRLHFSEVWHQKGGFDVVIGNPPYVSHDKVTQESKVAYKNLYETYEAFADIYCYFIEKSAQSLNKNGIVSLITSNSYLRANYGKSLRRFLSTNCDLISLVNIEDSQLFSHAIVNTAILISERKKYENDVLLATGSIDASLDFLRYIKQKGFLLPQNHFDERPWRLVPANIAELLSTIEKDKPSLEEMQAKIRLGLATGNNDAFVIDSEKRKELIKADPNSKNIIKPVLRGREIQRYFYEAPQHYILLTRNEINVKREYPAIYSYLDSLGSNFKKRGAKGKHWSNLRACSFFDDFKKPKIIWIELSDVGRFALCEEEIYLLNSAYFLLPPPSVRPEYLLAILNSSVIHFFLAHTAETSGMGTSRWINNHVKEFPIVIATATAQASIGRATEYCIFCKNKDLRLQSAYFEELIDSLVYELYFPEALNGAGKEMLQHLGELSPITDAMGETERLAVIQREFNRLYDPRHPVRNHLETLDSVDVVRTIRESLQRK